MTSHPGKSPIAVLGAGSWGTALAVLVSGNGFEVRLWGHESEHMGRLGRDNQNRQYLPGIPFPDRLRPTADLRLALSEAEQLLVVVPSHAFRDLLLKINPLLPGTTPISWATKGFEPGSSRLLHEVAQETLGDRDYAVISGPTFAKEVARGLPTAITVASRSQQQANRVVRYLHAAFFRAYTSNDVVGVEVGGATKNVLAIAAGIADGLGFGANTRAALITRGLAEIMRLGQVLGGETQTFMGLAGLGDLALTCTDDQSRNRRLGLALARGLSIEQARAEIGQEVEGIQTAQEVYKKARGLGVDMPITEQTYRVLYEGLAPKTAVQALLERRQKRELD